VATLTASEFAIFLCDTWGPQCQEQNQKGEPTGRYQIATAESKQHGDASHQQSVSVISSGL
jgi:hypothetical protein